MKFPAFTIRKLGVAVIVGAALTLGLFGQVAMASGPGPGGGGPGGGNGPGGGGGFIPPLPCSVAALASAITDRNSGGSGVILLASWCDYSISTPAASSDGLPLITGTVVIQGGLNSTISRASNAATLFRLLDVSATGDLTIKNVTLTGGNSASLGGGILNAGHLTVQGSTFSSNQGANGGGISVPSGGTAVITDTTFRDNKTTSVGGGAIINFGTVTLNDSHVLNNTAPINGGGINTQPGGKTTLTSTEVRGNSSGGVGGGVSNLGTTTLIGGTVTQNKGSSGGGIATGNTNVSLHATLVFGNTPDNCNPLGSIQGCNN